MRRTTLLAAAVVFLPAATALAKGSGGFQAPLTIPAGRPGPVTVNWGDFNGDGKLDLVVANGVASNEASGSPSILVLFQNPQNRQDWRPVSLRVGTSSVYVRGADMDSDGFDDIMVADNARSAFFVRSKGDGTFATPVAIAQANGARWIAVADFNSDGMLDFASSNFRASNLTAFLGNGAGGFTLSYTAAGSREHTIETLDYDGDGNLDLMQGSGLPGITPFQGQGNGKFAPQGNVRNLSCIEYIAEVGHYDRNGDYVLIGDFNLDGFGDLAVTCIDDGIAYAGISQGDGSYQRTFQAAGGAGTDALAIADLNGDDLPDLAMVSSGSTNLWVYPGEGDGTFQSPQVFGPTGTTPVFLISQDLDQDGHFDVVSADNTSYTVTVFWGQEGDPSIESGFSLTGYFGAKSAAAADVDRDGFPDLLFPRSDQFLVQVYRKPGFNSLTRPSFSITTQSKYTFLEAADLDRDGTVDLAGADPVGGKALVALLDAAGKPHRQLALDAGVSPSGVELGQLDEGGPLDMAVPCKGSNHVAIFLGLGAGGEFAEARKLPTVEKPKAAAIARLDGDLLADLAVIADTTVLVHFGTGGGEFTAPVTLAADAGKLYTDVAAADLNGDSIVDLAVAESRTVSVQVFAGRGGRDFADPTTVKTGGAPIALALADLDGDGRLDLTTSSATARSASVLLNRGAAGFAVAASYGLGLAPAGHLLTDIDRDGALDLIGFAASTSTVLMGHPDPAAAGHFRRGDANADQIINLGDAVLVLHRLFAGGPPLPCEDAGDADDSGTLALPDPVAILGWLFRQGEPLPAPGSLLCGGDPNADALNCAAVCH